MDAGVLAFSEPSPLVTADTGHMVAARVLFGSDFAFGTPRDTLFRDVV